MPEAPRLTALGKIAALIFIGLCFYGAYYFFFQRGSDGREATGSAPGPGAADGDTVEVGIAYGTEKKRWLEWAVQQFAKDSAGKNVKVNLIPLGSLEASQAILAGDKRIHVWSPASSLYKNVFAQEWELKHGSRPILKEEALALTPMVFVMWDERYQAFVQKEQTLTFKTIGLALQEKGGWDSIARRPEWGLFKFGHTHPNQSNSGLMTLVLMGYDYHNKNRDLQLKDVLDTTFQGWLQNLERGVSGLSNSTGNMMQEMVLKGPSSYDCLFVYESVAIDYLANAEGRWGSLRIVYPRLNMWNENPYYILDAPWSTDKHRRAAQAFLDFLLSEPVQRESLTHGFRPGNPAVPIRTPDSPFVRYERYGLQVDLSTMCDAPKAEVLTNMLAGWQRSQGAR
jgi:ABC-type glycerol-3-phosphate transport system substrate-binding protein